jgi:phosphoglycerate dehydrogenase-like enzyme
MAAATREGRRRSHVAAAEQVVQVLRGERPPFLLNPDVWPRRRKGAH